MQKNYGGIPDIARRAELMLQGLSDQIEQQRIELDQTEYYQTFTKNSVAKMPMLNRRAVDQAIIEMEEHGYEFSRRQTGSTSQYALTLQNVIDIYKHRNIPTYRDKWGDAFTIFVVNLKGGVSKTVSTVTLAHGLRSHPSLIHNDLRILVIDMDPQASSTMFLSHHNSIGSVLETAAQAMLNNVSREQLIEQFVHPTVMPGVDVMPASIDDAFVASEWNQLVQQYLPGISPSDVLRKTVIDRLSKDYDFIFIDTGPHLDAFMLNAIAASNLLLTPTPPAQVDFHSTMKYLTRLPEMIERIEAEGIELHLQGNIGFMSKMGTKYDHQTSQSYAREVFTASMLDASLPRLDGFERCGETFDTVISANPASYPGSPEALRNAKNQADIFVRAVFDRIEYIRSQQ
ncbi:AAA family ATPase [Xenorhabdus szentirmaii]|uniref:Plasmid partition protein A n=1 Tax=Xenorhabdus szentirmaii DSM 16338 TaxID=1427518 RepID=W1IYW9_9GAMM|nr:AAA family ATPase [Xenorhabdus szentirmaii]PHM30479.1 plasmid-partitioning protein SopA [Xenorhabdus szentirmaii DSM 16338]CDL83654.1 Plasmid partition protein A [Xenorhabdus szentirmaii DSM 16338]